MIPAIWIDYIGKVPEKDFVTINAKATEGIHDWQQKFAEEYKAQNNVAFLDTDYDSNEFYFTPLKEEIYINSYSETNLIKQVKAINDALSGVAYHDDMVIAELVAEVSCSYDYPEGATIWIYPVKYAVERDDKPTHWWTGYFRTIQDTVQWTDSVKKYQDDKVKDKEMQDRVQNGYIAEKVTCNFGLTAELETSGITLSTYPLYRKQMVEHQVLPTQRPDIDNCCYTILRNLYSIAYDDIYRCKKIHATKFYTDKDNPDRIQKIWIDKI